MVADEVSNQIDVADMLGDRSLGDNIDGGEVGAAVGREFGERFGREVGAAIGREVHETIAAGVEEGKELDEIRTDLSAAIKDALREAVANVEGRDSLESMAKGVTDGSSLEGLLDGVGSDESDDTDEDEAESEEQAESEDEEQTDETDTQDDGTESDETSTTESVKEATDTAKESVEGAASKAKETVGGESEDGEETAEESDESGDEAEPPEAGEDEPSAEDLEDLRKDTLEDFLGVMSYSDAAVGREGRRREGEPQPRGDDRRDHRGGNGRGVGLRLRFGRGIGNGRSGSRVTTVGDETIDYTPSLPIRLPHTTRR